MNMFLKTVWVIRTTIVLVSTPSCTNESYTKAVQMYQLGKLKKLKANVY